MIYVTMPRLVKVWEEIAMPRQIITIIALLSALLVAPFSQCLAASTKEIDIEVDAALARFGKEVHGGPAFLSTADGVLVFPDVVKAGFGIGGEYGEGALRVKGATVDYYSTAAGSIGFQLGIQSKAVILVFLEESALEKFRRSDGWEVGVDGSVALIEVGAGGAIDTTNIKDPIVGFVMTNKGLMFNLTLEGSKITKLEK
jgi:lipid-binding SYLF domain-containing protein